MPPDLLGNIVASSAWMLFCSAPKVIDTVQRTNAPVVPSAPIDEPNAAMRKPGFASATTKPSHQVIALRSCLSSTSACAIGPFLSTGVPQKSTSRTNWYRTSRRRSTTPFGRRQRTACRFARRRHARPGAIEVGLYKFVRTILQPRRDDGRQSVGGRALLGPRLRLGPRLGPD